MSAHDDADSIENELREFLHARREEVATAWNRSLSFGDYVSDRWEKAQSLGFGEGSSVYDSVTVIGDVKVGPNTWVGPQVVLDGSGGLSIGSHCSVSAGVQIYSHDSVRWAVSGGKEDVEHASTTVGSNVYLGPNVVVAKGVSIGDRCVIGANSVVLSDIPTGVMAAGNPCKVIRSLPE